MSKIKNLSLSPWPCFTQEEADAVSRVLLSNQVNYWTGEECKIFEKEFAKWCGTNYAIALANGTVALELALKGLNIGPGDEVVVTPRTFIASVSCIINVGATPVFADVDRDSQNITADSIEPLITAKTRAIICVHLAGWPCDMEPIVKLADRHGLSVIEDCAQAHGARYKGKPVGSFGHVAAWSFCQDKIMTTGGEGGMLTTNDKALWSRLWSYKDHGKNLVAISEGQSSKVFSWVHESIGTNGRMTEMQAAIGRIQLRRIEQWHTQRKSNATLFAKTLSCAHCLRMPWPSEHEDHAWYKFSVFVKSERLKKEWSRNRILSEINARGVPCQTGPCPEVYLEKAFDGNDCRPRNRLAIAKELGETSLVVLVHPTLGENEIKKMSEIVLDVLAEASHK